jgi:hypothetical protein
MKVLFNNTRLIFNSLKLTRVSPNQSFEYITQNQRSAPTYTLARGNKNLTNGTYVGLNIYATRGGVMLFGKYNTSSSTFTDLGSINLDEGNNEIMFGEPISLNENEFIVFYQQQGGNPTIPFIDTEGVGMTQFSLNDQKWTVYGAWEGAIEGIKIDD